MISLFLNSLLFENVILTKYLGICPFIGASNKESTSFNLGIATTITMVIVSVLTYIINELVLVPYNIEYFKILVFILVIASVVQIINIIVKNKFIKLYNKFGIYLPLIATNCAVFGVTLINSTTSSNILEVLVYSLGSGLGFTFIITLFASLRERIDNESVPKSFRGVPIAFIIASIMILIFGRIG